METSSREARPAMSAKRAPDASKPGTQPPAEFEKVLTDELAIIRGGESASPGETAFERAQRAGLTGLAFSGGGIRSATFNLGVLQALGELGLLKKFDYLSTVSGGGYIGAWLAALIGPRGAAQSAQPIEEVEKSIASADHTKAEAEVHGKKAIGFLRAYSNYLTPRLGLFSLDTLASVATYLRNLYLNLTVLVLVLAAALMLPRVAVWLEARVFAPWAIVAAILLVAWSVEWIAINLLYDPAKAAHDGHPWFTRHRPIFWVIGLPVILSAWACSHFLWSYQAQQARMGDSLWPWALLTGALYLLLWIVGGFAHLIYQVLYALIGHRIVALVKRFQPGAIPLRPADEPWAEVRDYLSTRGQALASKDFEWWITLFASAAVSGLAGGVLLRWLAQAFARFDPGLAPWVLAAFGTALTMKVFSLILVLHIGLMGRQFQEDEREWWSRLGGLVLGTMLGWIGLFAVALFGPALLIWGWSQAYAWIVGAGSGWLITTVSGVLAGRNVSTGTRKGVPWLEWLAHAAPYVFVVGFLLAISLGIQLALGQLGKTYSLVDPTPCPTPSGSLGAVVASQLCQMDQWNGRPWELLLVAVLAGICAILLAWRVNINVFSIHHYYRYRLTRCYLGASNPDRSSHPFTGFDPRDDVPLSNFARRPYPIINTALNLVQGGQLAWQKRKAASFVFTPRYCGYSLAIKGHRGCYRPTSVYGGARSGGVYLGTAMAISGAAASPNMGFHTSPAIAFMLTVFNVRLGRWCGNPAHPNAWRHPDPRFGLRYLLAELFGAADQDYPFVYLSDGGHFENMAIYELVRRRCQVIVACDCGADKNIFFDDLANAIRKCYTDFNVEIEIDVSPIRPAGDSQRSRLHYAVGTIRYDKAFPGARPGNLLVIKPSLTGNEPLDILNYKDNEPDFPQQTTADQWFDEDQFESYRKLGYHIVGTVFAKAIKRDAHAGISEMVAFLERVSA